MVETIEVYVGECRTEHFECGLLNFLTDSLENFGLHLEVYEYKECKLRVKILKDMKRKTHTDKEHGGS